MHIVKDLFVPNLYCILNKTIILNRQIYLLIYIWNNRKEENQQQRKKNHFIFRTYIHPALLLKKKKKMCSHCGAYICHKELRETAYRETIQPAHHNHFADRDGAFVSTSSNIMCVYMQWQTNPIPMASPAPPFAILCELLVCTWTG